MNVGQEVAADDGAEAERVRRTLAPGQRQAQQPGEQPEGQQDRVADAEVQREGGNQRRDDGDGVAKAALTEELPAEKARAFVSDGRVEEDDQFVSDHGAEADEEHSVGGQHGGLWFREERLPGHRPRVPPGELVIAQQRVAKRVRPGINELVPVPVARPPAGREQRRVNQEQQSVVDGSPGAQDGRQATLARSARSRCNFGHGPSDRAVLQIANRKKRVVPGRGPAISARSSFRLVARAARSLP